MNRKSFIRGFGLGVLFAAIILGISCMIRTSDTFVKSRAKQLGMVYAQESEDDLNIVSPSPKVASSSEPSSTASVGGKDATSKNNTSSSDENSMKKEKEALEKDVRDEEKKLTIDAGEWSSDVSKKLQDLGVIKSATDFDKYLNENGFSSSISAGTYDVSMDETYKELAKKITGK